MVGVENPGEDGGMENDEEGKHTILRQESLSKVQTDLKNFFMSYTSQNTWHMERIRMPWRLGTSPGAGCVTSLRLRSVSVCRVESF